MNVRCDDKAFDEGDKRGVLILTTEHEEVRILNDDNVRRYISKVILLKVLKNR
jgi:hypothetical protein